MKNTILEDLKTLGIGKETIKFHNKTRDRKDIKVLQDIQSGALFLDHADHIKDHYENIKGGYFNDDPINELDTERRKELLDTFILEKWLDIGTGQGKILSGDAECIEPQGPVDGFKTYKDISEVNKKYTLITMFHVLEHIPNQIEYMQKCFKLLHRGGSIIIEVPNARDNLIEVCKKFRDFTFWSEHLILHTDKTLIELLLHAGFDEIQVIPVQRYPLANHLYWQKEGKPGGHIHMRCDALSEQRYKTNLIRKGKTDTILVIAKKP